MGAGACNVDFCYQTPRRGRENSFMCVGGLGACVCRLRSSRLTTVVLLCRSQKAKQARLEPPPAFSRQQIPPIKEKKMCWRERFLPSRSSLMTYTGKEFVYIIIFSLTASPKAAMIQAPPASPAVRSAWDGRREGCSCHRASPKPSGAHKPLCKPSVPQPPPASAWALRLTYGSGIPGARGSPPAGCSRWDVSGFGSEGDTGAKSSPRCCPTGTKRL